MIINIYATVEMQNISSVTCVIVIIDNRTVLFATGHVQREGMCIYGS